MIPLHVHVFDNEKHKVGEHNTLVKGYKLWSIVPTLFMTLFICVCNCIRNSYKSCVICPIMPKWKRKFCHNIKVVMLPMQ